MAIEITTENCREIMGRRLCGLAENVRVPIINAVCSVLKNYTLDCDNIKECETLTSLSEFVTVDGEICITYRDEEGVDTQRCFSFEQNEFTITADNGLNKSNETNVQLGGDLTTNTVISSNGFTITIAGITLYNDGHGQLTSYGVGTFVDTPVYTLGVLADGSIIEYIPSTEVDVEITADNGLTAETPTNIQLGGPISSPAILLHDTYIDSGGFSLTMSGINLAVDGSIDFLYYGIGAFVGIPDYILGVDSGGNVVETALDLTSVVTTADNGLSKDTLTNVQLGSATTTGAPLLHDSYISGDFNLSLQDGSLTVGTTTPVSAKITAKTVDTNDFFSIIGLKQNAVGSSTGAGIAMEGQFLVTGGTSYNNTAPLGGLYGELGFQGSGNWAYANGAKYVQLGGLSGVMTIYTVDTSNYTSGASLFSGGQYFLNVAGTGTIDKFASLRALYPITTPGLSYNGIITDHYGLYIDDHTEGGHFNKITNRWGVYQPGIGETNFFAGPMVLNLGDFADDTAANGGGVPLNGLYRTGSFVKIRVGV